MRQLQHVTAEDKIYLMYKGELKEITLTDDHINNRSADNPSFVIGKLRLKSSVIRNDQVELEIGLCLDKFCRSDSEHGWHFAGEPIIAFISKEALDRYYDLQSRKSELIRASLDQLNERLSVQIEEIRKEIEDHAEYVKSIGATDDDLSEFKEYRLINDLNRAIGNRSIFYRD